MKPGWRTPGHAHTFYELGIVSRGGCHWMLPRVEEEVEIRQGEAILIAPGQWHHEELCGESVSIEWTGFLAPPDALRGIPLARRLCLNDWSGNVFSCTQQIHIEMIHQPEGHAERIPLLLADLLLLLRRVSRSVPPPRPRHSRTDQLETARLFLEHHPGAELTIEQVARYHGYSVSHFETLFTKRYSLSPKRYQQQIRLKSVLQTICDGIRSPKELAARHGFSDPAYFCRWFRKQTGTTPSLWQG